MNELAMKLAEVYTANDLAVMYLEQLSRDKLIEESVRWGVLSKEFKCTTYDNGVSVETINISLDDVTELYHEHMDELDDLITNDSFAINKSDKSIVLITRTV